MRLYVAHNTSVNEAPNSTFVRNFAGGDVIVTNNPIFGDGEVLSGQGSEADNLQLPLDDLIADSWDAPIGSATRDGAVELPHVEGIQLAPSREFDR